MTARGPQAQWNLLAKLGDARYFCKPCTEFFESRVGSAAKCLRSAVL
jgi:hypothetical protein